MPDDYHGLPTSRTTLRAGYVRFVVLTCRSCLHQRDADLEALGASGRGDVPLVKLRWQCVRCGHRKIDMVVTGKETVKPW